jgi:hypothetical protein
MKLFVVGEDSPDPRKWSGWSGWSLVIAADEAQAISLADGVGPATAIPMDAPLYIMSAPEPWGEDV